MILEIKKYPDPVLRRKTKNVGEITPEVKKLITDMKETMAKSDGVGLSASQVGREERIFVIQTQKGAKAFINPGFTKKSKKAEIDEEGCLSFPGLYLKIKRPREVELEALDEDGKKIQIKAEGLMARVFQHEVDHLDGVVFIDRLGFWKRLKLKM